MTQTEFEALIQRYMGILSVIEQVSNAIQMPEKLKTAALNLAQHLFWKALERYITENLS